MYYFIVNPTSKTGLGEKHWKRVEKILKERDITYKVVFSKRIGHVEQIVKKLTGETKKEQIHLVILGGDGTVNEAVQGIEDFSKVKFSYIPTGSSNDLARDMGISTNPEEALEAILKEEKEAYMDMGILHYDRAVLNGEEVQLPDRRFMVGCGIGFDAAVCEESVRSKMKLVLNKLKLGKLTYLGIALKQLIQSQMIDGKITIDNQEAVLVKRMFFAVSMVHHYQGGGFKFCPDAKADDGILDFCIASDASKLRVLRILPTAYDGKHVRFKEIQMFTGKKAVIETEKPMWVQTDGEVKAQASKITVSDLGKKVHFIY